MREDLLRIVDVGALGGLEGGFAQHAGRLWPILFEPNPIEAQKIRGQLSGFKKSLVIEAGLGHIDGVKNFLMTRNPTCSSVLEPNFDYLNQYGIAYHFAVARKGEIQISRYDTLFENGVVPLPDAIKIDVQGFEYEVLLGFGSLLKSALAIKLEAHLYPVYRGQKLLGDLVGLLGQSGFNLRYIDLNKLENFAGDCVEVDAYFSKDRRAVRNLSSGAREKFDLIAEVWKLPSYDYHLP
jgi:FkbM family methyltransferase